MKETDNKHKAHCRACNKDIDVAQMGESALRSQASGDRHKKHEQSLSGTFTNFFIKKETKVKTASTQSDNTSDNIMIPPRGVTIYRYIGILRYGARGTVYRYAHTRIPVYRNTVRVLY